MKHRNYIYQRRYVINWVALCEDTLHRPNLIVHNSSKIFVEAQNTHRSGIPSIDQKPGHDSLNVTTILRTKCGQ